MLIECKLACLQAIKKHENAHVTYQKQLLDEGVVKKEQIDEIHDNISKILSSEYEAVCSLPRHLPALDSLSLVFSCGHASAWHDLLRASCACG